MKGINIFTADVIKDFSCNYYDKIIQVLWKKGNKAKKKSYFVTIAFQCVLISSIKKKIALGGDVYFRSPITFESHDLHAGDIRGFVSEIAFYHGKD
jgi:hypothetical protein